MLDVRLLFLVLRFLVHLVLSTGLDVGRIVPAVQIECLAHGEVVDLGANAVKEVCGMRRKDEDRLPLRQVILEPHASAQVEVIGGLVEYEQHRTNEQRLRESDAHAPPSGHVFCRSLHHRLREAEAVQELARPLVEGGGIHLVQLLVNRLEARVVRPSFSHDLLLQCVETFLLLAHRVDHEVNSRLIGGRSLVVEVPNVDEVRDGDEPRGDCLQKGRLPGAVLGDHAVAVTPSELESLVLEELLPKERDRKGLQLHILRVFARRQHSSGYGVLQGAFVDFLQPVIRCGSLFPFLFLPFRLFLGLLRHNCFFRRLLQHWVAILIDLVVA
mmetsp:Transcript_4685/g.11795  ORF Transcript_4685/g.11795 Transcript_4685/m.11795 type:complete len:328 (+) Transcript_4685:1355-2338(+)